MKRLRPHLSRWERIWVRYVGTLTFILLVIDLISKGHS